MARRNRHNGVQAWALGMRECARCSACEKRDRERRDSAGTSGAHREEPTSKPAWVYELISAGAVVYVGASTDPARRLYQHRYARAGVRIKFGAVERFCCEAVAYRVERERIYMMQPPWNKANASRQAYQERYVRNLHQRAIARRAELVRIISSFDMNDHDRVANCIMEALRPDSDECLPLFL